MFSLCCICLLASQNSLLMPYAFSFQENKDTKFLLNMVVMVLSSSILGIQTANAPPIAAFSQSMACLLFAVLF